MGQPGLASERRRSLRAPVHGHATIHENVVVVGGTIDNLSLGGARVVFAGKPLRIDALAIDLRLPNAQVAVSGHAVRIEERDSGARLAIQFDDLVRDVADAIADAVVTSYMLSRRRPVLIVDGIEERRLDVAEALRVRKMLPLTPSTALEAMDAMVGPSPPEVCVVSARFGDAPGKEFASVIADAFPWVRILYLGKDSNKVADAVKATLDELDEITWQRLRAC